MHLFFRLICQIIGNCFLWLVNLGTISFDEITKKDNYLIGFIIIIMLVGFAFYAKN